MRGRAGFADAAQAQLRGPNGNISADNFCRRWWPRAVQTGRHDNDLRPVPITESHTFRFCANFASETIGDRFICRFYCACNGVLSGDRAQSKLIFIMVWCRSLSPLYLQWELMVMCVVNLRYHRAAGWRLQLILSEWISFVRRADDFSRLSWNIRYYIASSRIYFWNLSCSKLWTNLSIDTRDFFFIIVQPKYFILLTCPRIISLYIQEIKIYRKRAPASHSICGSFE